MVKGIIFDLDGTLLNTLPDIHKVLNESLFAFGLPPATLEKTRRMVGDGAKKLIERAVGEQNAGLISKVYEHYSEHFSICDNSNTKLYAGEEHALKLFKDMGLKLAIVTNKPQIATLNVYKKYLSCIGFDKVIGQSEKFPLKPDPTSVICIAEEWKIKRENLLFVGDGDADIITAKNAAIRCVSVLWGYRTRKQLEEVGGLIFAENFRQLEELVIKL